jgi:hypothetical protein
MWFLMFVWGTRIRGGEAKSKNLPQRAQRTRRRTGLKSKAGAASSAPTTQGTHRKAKHKTNGREGKARERAKARWGEACSGRCVNGEGGKEREREGAREKEREKGRKEAAGGLAGAPLEGTGSSDWRLCYRCEPEGGWERAGAGKLECGESGAEGADENERRAARGGIG